MNLGNRILIRGLVIGMIGFDVSAVIVVFNDTFEHTTAGGALTTDVNFDYADRQAEGGVASAYTEAGVGADASLWDNDLVSTGCDSDILLLRLFGNTDAISQSLDLNADFGPWLAGRTWTLSYRGWIDGTLSGYNAWVGFSVGSAPTTPSIAAFGVNIYPWGSANIWTNGVKAAVFNVGSLTGSGGYGLEATFDEEAGTVQLFFSSASTNADLGTYHIVFSDAVRKVELKALMAGNAAFDGSKYADFKFDDLTIRSVLDPPPFTVPGIMENESVVFCSDLQTNRARLLFDPVEIQSVKRADGSRVFEEGVDYTVDPDGWMTLTPSSSIPVLDYYTNQTDSTYYRFTDTNGFVFYSPGGVYKHRDWDVVVTYTCTNGSLDELAEGAWESKLMVALDQNPLNVTFFGDSITAGGQASFLAPGAPPFAPAYPLRVIDRLKDRFGYPHINYANKAVGGKTSSWGLQEIQQVIDTSPDLVVLAFGMNDASGNVPSATYKQNTEDMIQALRTANPDVGIVLVAEFSPNPEWANAHYELRAEDRDALYDLYSSYDNMAVVDVGAVSRQIAARKKFQDFSGNNLNHPNDFLHAVYAYLVENAISATDSDGDGMCDADEPTLGRDPSDAADMAFFYDTERDFEGWVDDVHNISGLVVSNGVMEGTAVTIDPYVANSSVNFQASEVSNICVRMRAGANAGVQLYWAPTGGTFVGNYITQLYSGGGDWQVLEFDPAGNTSWDGKAIDKLRIDPIASAGAWFEIDWIRSANGDTDNDGFLDWQEDITGTDRLDPAENSFRIPAAALPVKVNGKTGRNYFLQWSATLVSAFWETVETAGPLASDQSVVFTNGTPSTNGFYRVLVGKP